MDDHCEPHEGGSGHAVRGNGPGLLGGAFALVTHAIASVLKDGSIAAIAREAIKDVRNSVHEVFFGRSEHHGEPGAPLNPTQGEIAAARRDTSVHGEPPMRSPGEIAAAHTVEHGSVHGLRSPAEIAAAHTTQHAPVRDGPALGSPSEIAATHSGNGQVENGDGHVFSQEPKSWIEREHDREKARQEGNAENDQNERGRGRSLPDEQRERERERSRER